MFRSDTWAIYIRTTWPLWYVHNLMWSTIALLLCLNEMQVSIDIQENFSVIASKQMPGCLDRTNINLEHFWPQQA